MALSYVRCLFLRSTFAATAPASAVSELGVVNRCYDQAMIELTEIIPLAVTGATCGVISGVTTWMLNVYNMEKACLEIERLKKELSRSDNRLLTPNDPSWKQLSEEAIQTFETIRMRSRISSNIPVVILAGALTFLLLGRRSQTETQLAADVANARSLATSQQQQLAQRETELQQLKTALQRREDELQRLVNERRERDEPHPTAGLPEKKYVVEEYLVKKGDTLTSIAKKLKVPEDRIRDANGLKRSERLSEGRVLIIPK